MKKKKKNKVKCSLMTKLAHKFSIVKQWNIIQQ